MDIGSLALMWQGLPDKDRRQFMAGLVGMMSLYIPAEAEENIMTAAQELAEGLKGKECFGN